MENINIDDEASEVNGSFKKKREKIIIRCCWWKTVNNIWVKLQLSDIDKMTTEQINKLYCKYEARLGAKQSENLKFSALKCQHQKDGKQIANMLYHAGVETLLTVGYAEIVMQMKKIRHDKAIEKLEKAQADWNKRRIQRLDFINEQLQKEHHAVQTFEDVDQAMKQYYYITSKIINSIITQT
ncbi:unnamed protein product [Mytilus coruscus]|uniref:Uncharacterized protein n=1 Tax=Mytilus coruscus TaxID=42192 RepID=A0A6J8APY5_MYTCO|nr:unnamed protein product [Mytilus coruscus]